MPARLVPFQVICLCNHGAFDEEAFRPLREIFDSSQADLWLLLNPGVVLAYFQVDDAGAQRAEQLIGKLTEILAAEQEKASCGIGRSEGPLIAVSNWMGRLRTAPLGVAVNEAIALARRNTPTT